MIFLIVGILILLGLCFPKSKIVAIVISIAMICMVGLRSSNSVDYFFYYMEYLRAPLISYKEADFPGYNILMNIFNNFHLTFEQVAFILAIVCVVLMYIGLYNLSANTTGYISFALALFLIYPFGHEAIQTRTFLADSIVMVVLPFLIKPENKVSKQIINYIIYFLGVYLASTVHTLAYFFILVGIIYILTKSLALKKELLLVVFFSVIAVVLVKSRILSSFIISTLNTEKQAHWVEVSDGSSLGALLPAIITVLIWYLGRFAVHYALMYSYNSNKQAYLLNIERFLNLIILIIPLMFYDITFNRLWRIFLVILFLFSGFVIYFNDKENKLERIIYTISFIILVVVISCLYEHEYLLLESMF